MSGRTRSRRTWLLVIVLLGVSLGAFACWRLRSADSAARVGKGSAKRPSGLRWQLETGADTSLAGRVADLEQQPIDGAEVCAHVLSPAAGALHAARCARTNAQGLYAIRGVEPCSYTVTASALGFVAASASEEALALHAGEARRGVDVQLHAGAINLSGTVVDATGGPVPDARVRVEARAPRLVVDARTDDLGNFSFALPAGPVALQAAAPGYSTASETRVVPSSAVRLVIVPGASLRGRVSARESGLPLAGIELRAEPNGAQPARLGDPPRSDVRGAFTIDGLEPGSYFVTAVGPGLRGRSDTPYELALGQVIDGIELTVFAVAQVSGHVLQSDGQPCARGSLQLGAPDPLNPLGEGSDHIVAQMQAPALLAEIGAEGAVQFAAVEPGKYYVTARCLGQMLQEGPRVLEVGAEDVSGLVWRVAAGASLRVLTVDERDQPVGGVEFTLQLPSFRAWAEHSITARSDAAGRYDIEGILAPGTYRLIATASYYSAQPVNVQVRAPEQNVAKLKLAGSAAIEVTLRAGGETVEGLSVTAIPMDAAGVAAEVNPALAIELGAGRYRMAPLPAGRFEVRVEDGINPGVASESVELESGSKAQLEIALDRTGKVAGRVVDDRGSAVADAWVTILADALTATRGASMQRAAFATLLPGRVLTDAQGEFSFERLAGGGATYSLEVSVPSTGAAKARAVKAGNTQLELVLQTVGSVAGKVEGVCGKGAPHPVTIQTQSLDTGQMLAPTRTSREGTFVVTSVAPGALRITAYCEHPTGLVMGVTTAQLAPGQKLEGVTVSLQLRGQGHEAQ